MKLEGLAINKSIPLPLYYQIKEMLLEFIHKSPEGTLIPTEVALCEHFEVSRQTVRQAISELASEGYLTRKKGKGTFVSEHQVKQDFLLMVASFDDEMRRKGFTSTTKVLEFTLEKSDAKMSEILGLKKGSDIVKLRRLRFANSEPFVLVLTYLPYYKMTKIMSVDFNKTSLYKVMEEDYQLTIETASMILESYTAKEFQAKHLGIKVGDPIQMIQRVTYLPDGTPIEFSKAEYRGDRNKFTINLKRDHI